MTKSFLYGSLIMGLSCLGLGWLKAGYWPVGLVLLLLIPLSFLLTIRNFRPTLGLVLTITVFFSALGLWAHVDLSLALLAVVFILAAWDLDAFAQSLVFASAEDDPQRIERQHLMQVNLILFFAVALNLVFQTIRYVFDFEWVLGLAILAFYGFGVLVNRLRQVGS